jgi:hypothetical protein
VLDASAAHLTSLLDEFDDLVEMQVDADDDEVEALAAVASLPGMREGRGGDLAATIEQGRQIASVLMQRRADLAEAIVQRLRPLCVDDMARATIRGPEDPVLRWAFLVRRDDLHLLDDAIVALRADYPTVSLRYAGPLPPAHFIDRVVQERTAQSDADTFAGNGSWGW